MQIYYKKPFVLIIAIVLFTFSAVTIKASDILPYPKTLGVVLRNHIENSTNNKTKESVQGLGYLGNSRSQRDATGVMINSDKSSSKPVLYSTKYRANLIDRNGSIIRSWKTDPRDIFGASRISSSSYMRNSRLTENGGLYALYHYGIGLVKFDKNGEVLWKRALNVVNTFTVVDNKIYLLVNKEQVVPGLKSAGPVLAPDIYVLDKNTGHTINKYSIGDAFSNSPYRSFLYTAYKLRYQAKDDVFHPNSIQYITGDIAQAHPHLEAGDFVLSLRYPSAIITFDPDNRTITNVEHGRTWLQHSTYAHKNGTITAFNNLHKKGESQVLAFDPTTGKQTFSYTGSNFYSGCCGRVERLENGHYLITETERGRIFELTPQKKVVWEYYNPEKENHSGETFLAAIYQGRSVSQSIK